MHIMRVPFRWEEDEGGGRRSQRCTACDLGPENVACASWRDGPTIHIVGVRPHEVTESALTEDTGDDITRDGGDRVGGGMNFKRVVVCSGTEVCLAGGAAEAAGAHTRTIHRWEGSWKAWRWWLTSCGISCSRLRTLTWSSVRISGDSPPARQSQQVAGGSPEIRSQ